MMQKMKDEELDSPGATGTRQGARVENRGVCMVCTCMHSSLPRHANVPWMMQGTAHCCKPSMRKCLA